mmetsp:Transcript_16895/g.47104  ORF Transcript_16895/g.47104 Transcript_16895/m.47104 type:complete len:195 (+) Transcript_16895:400-984(+)
MVGSAFGAFSHGSLAGCVCLLVLSSSSSAAGASACPDSTLGPARRRSGATFLCHDIPCEALASNCAVSCLILCSCADYRPSPDRCESDDDKRLPEHSTAANAGAPGVAFGQPAAMEPSAGGGRSRGKTKTFSNVFASGGGGCQVDPSNGGAGAAEPSFTVNMTGGAADGGTSGTRAAPSANSDNPFFGNAHLTK